MRSYVLFVFKGASFSPKRQVEASARDAEESGGMIVRDEIGG